ncbi:MAG: alpha-2-macroglobulin family protein [Fusobacteriaceae bacterium]|nr:alpha-2-macroglobulin family protein [Fusobacteriaceae bacterium]
MKKYFLLFVFLILIACGKTDDKAKESITTVQSKTSATVVSTDVAPESSNKSTISESTITVEAVSTESTEIPTVATTTATTESVESKENIENTESTDTPAVVSPEVAKDVSPELATTADVIPTTESAATTESTTTEIPPADAAKTTDATPVTTTATVVVEDTRANPKAEDTLVKVVSIEGKNKENDISIEITMSKNILDGFDPVAYVRVSDGVIPDVYALNNVIILKGDFDAEKTYTVTLLKGIKAADNSQLQSDVSEKIGFYQLEPKVSFSNEGIVLPSTSDKNILFRSINVKKVNIEVTKVYENNFTQFLSYFTFNGNGRIKNDYGDYDNYYSNEMLEKVGDVIFSKEFDINYVKNSWTQSSIDLKDVINGNGMYIVKVNFTKDNIFYNFPSETSEWEKDRLIYRNGNITKTVILADIGIIAQQDIDGQYIVKTMDILKNVPIVGSKVKLISSNNQILEEKTSDENGDVVFTNTKKAFYILSEYGDGKSVLKLTESLSMDGFKVGGTYATHGINSFIYTERGVYRPGDPIHVSIIIRNNNEPLPNDHPVKINIFTPTGIKYIENDVITSGKNGFYTYTFKTKSSDNTGLWRLEATVGNKTISKNIMVETVIPYEIKNHITVPEPISANSGSFVWYIDSQYLFGAPASKLKVEGEIVIKEQSVSFENYKNYNFKIPGSYSYTDYDYFEGVLDENGHIAMTTGIDRISYRSLNVILELQPRVLENSGRPVRSFKEVFIKKFDNYLGIERPIDRYINRGETQQIKVITPDLEGNKLVSGRHLRYSVYHNRHSWWWDYDNYDSYIRSIKDDKITKLIVSKEFESTADPYIIEFVPEMYGDYYVEVEDLDNAQASGTSFYSTDWADPTEIKKIEGLKISSDKTKYKSNEKAYVNFEGTKGSKALIAIEKSGKIIKRYIKDIAEDVTREEIDLDKTMAPNIYVHVSLLQDYNQKENDRPLRLYGTVPIVIEDEETKLEILIDAPESVRPNEKFTVKIKNNQNIQMDYTIALVDEGLLGLTSFATPTPWEYFYQKIASSISLYDNYSSIIGKAYGDIHQILKAGGGFDLAASPESRRKRDLGIEDEDRFEPVSLYKGVLTTDEKGEAEIEFEIANYMGAVRVMVVGANGNAYGSAEKEILVKAPIVVLEALPRTLKVNDEFKIPVKIFALEEDIGDIEVYYKNDKITQMTIINLKKGEEETVYFRGGIEPKVGKTQITIGVKSKVYNYEKTVGIAINSNNLPIYINEDKILSGREEISFKNDKEYVKNTVDSMLTISNSPILSIDQRLKYLIHYPYGCAEQTTSSVLPQLFIDRLMTNKNYDKRAVINNINAGISRLSELFQLNDGSFSYWPGEKETNQWVTNYIGTFLILARQNGYNVQDTTYNKFIDYTKKYVRDRKTNNNNDSYYYINRTYSLFLLALSGNGILSEMNYIYDSEINRLNDISKMYLATAYKLMGEEKTAKEIVEKYPIKKNIMDNYGKNQDYYRYTYGSSFRDMSIYLYCYYTIYGKFDEEIYNGVLSRLKGKDWYSTQETAYALLAISNISSSNDGKEIKGKVEIDGVAQEYVANGRKQIIIPEEAVEIKVVPDTDGNTYINYYLEGTPLNEKVDDYFDGFLISRNFYNNNGEPIDVRELESGKSFWLEIIVSNTQATANIEVDNIALTQILSSGWEIENLRVTGEEYPTWIKVKTGNTDGHIKYMDIRDDRVLWFFNYGYNDRYYSYYNGYYRFFTKINTVTKGSFDFPGTKLEAMYEDRYKAHLGGFRVRVIDSKISTFSPLQI